MSFLSKSFSGISKGDNQKNSDDYILALDIGTEYVKALIAKKGRGHDLEIVGVGRTHQRDGNIFGGAIANIPNVVRICEDALIKAEDMAGVRARDVVVGIAGELIKGNTSTIKYRRSDVSKSISEDEMHYIIEKVQERAGEQARRQVALESNNPEVEVRLINSALVSIRIDGYKVTNPVGFKGKDVSVQLYTAYAPLVHLSAIERVCDELSLDLITVAVEPFAVCRACLGDDIDSDFSSIVMDIGGGTTDVALINNSGVEGTKMFGIGGRAFTHQIAKECGVSFADAEKLKLLVEDPKMKTRVRQKIQDAIQRNLNVWISGVELAIDDFKQIEALPDQILLCGGGASLSDIPELLATGDWYEELAFTRRPVIQLIEPDDVPGITNSTDYDLNHSFITAMGLLRVGVDTLIGVGDDKSFRAKLAKLLQN